MTEQLVFKKAVDMSMLKEGLSIPSDAQKQLYAAIGHVVRSGESIPIFLKIENETYPATLKNQAFNQSKYPDRVDIVQIRYAPNSDVAGKLRSLFTFTMNLVQHFLSENPNASNHLLIPEGQREYIAVFADDPGTLRLECIPHRSTANIHGGVFIPFFKIGDTVSNEQLYKEFGCGNMGGMRPSKINKCLVIISDHTKSLYDDKWYGDELHYTGMGKNGDQTLADECIISVAYEFGELLPVILNVVTDRAHNSKGILDLVKKNFDFRPGAIIDQLSLKKTKYLPTATYGHFTNCAYPWEHVIDLNR